MPRTSDCTCDVSRFTTAGIRRKVGNHHIASCPLFRTFPADAIDQSEYDELSIHQPPASPKSEQVDHPAHYNQGGIECIAALEACSTPIEFFGWLRLTIIKYLWRVGHKDALAQEAAKAKWYQDFLANWLAMNPEIAAQIEAILPIKFDPTIGVGGREAIVHAQGDGWSETPIPDAPSLHDLQIWLTRWGHDTEARSDLPDDQQAALINGYSDARRAVESVMQRPRREEQ